MAFERVSGYGGQLSSHDVLYNRSRLDAVLFLPDADGKVYRSGQEPGGGDVREYAGKPADSGGYHGDYCDCRYFNLLAGTSKGC